MTPKLPKNLKLKIGSKKEVAWTGLKEQTEQAILQGEISIIVNKAIVELAEREIKKEKDL